MTTIEHLGILDFGGRRDRRPTWTAINETVRFARLAEDLGYHRYWLAEHQSLGDAWGSATVMIGHLAARTTRIRVGSAGVLFGFHDPFDVASDYRLLSALHRGRIDIGLAGGGPSMVALRDRHAGRDYFTDIGALVGLLRARPEDGAESGLIPVPADVTVDMPWILGSGERSTEAAIVHRTAYCYSLFHSPRVDPAFVARYLDRFAGGSPRASICASVLCAETEHEARAIFERQAAGLQARGATLNAIGSPAQCAEQLETLAARYRVDEIVIHDVTRTVPERRRAYELLAEALLPARVPVAASRRVG